MNQRTAFTRIELVVVLTIIALLVGIGFVCVQKIRSAANRMADT